MSIGDTLNYDSRPEQYSVAEQSNHTFVSNINSFNFGSAYYTIQDSNFTVSFKNDGSFEFNTDPEKVLENLSKSKHSICKGLAALIYATYKAGIQGKPIPIKGKLEA